MDELGMIIAQNLHSFFFLLEKQQKTTYILLLGNSEITDTK